MSQWHTTSNKNRAKALFSKEKRLAMFGLGQYVIY